MNTRFSRPGEFPASPCLSTPTFPRGEIELILSLGTGAKHFFERKLQHLAEIHLFCHGLIFQPIGNGDIHLYLLVLKTLLEYLRVGAYEANNICGILYLNRSRGFWKPLIFRNKSIQVEVQRLPCLNLRLLHILIGRVIKLIFLFIDAIRIAIREHIPAHFVPHMV